MCQFASFVLTKGRVFWSNESESHTEIIKENNLHEMGSHGPNIIKVEIIPNKKIKVWPSLKAWDFRIDQDILPKWHDADATEKRTREALQRRYDKGFTTVDAMGCTALTAIDAPKATTVRARGCTALTAIDAPTATYVDASGCNPNLRITAAKGASIYR